MLNLETDIEFPQLVIKQLLEKSNEKRKLATKEIEKIVKLNADNDDHGQIMKIIEYFRDKFIFSNQSHFKKGGLLAFSAISVAVSSNELLSQKLISELITPPIAALKDTDPRVRFGSCESLYNIIKALREISLLSFNDIFKSLVNVISDMDEEVRRAAQTLDRILKDVVTESSPNSKWFNLQSFMPVFCEKLNAVNPSIRQMLISWINILDSIPNINLIRYLPSFLEQLFSMLNDGNKEISNAVEHSLSEFSKEIKDDINNRSVEIDSEIIDILVKILNKKVNGLAKFNALIWINKYLTLISAEIDDKGWNPNHYSPLRKVIFLKYPLILNPILTLLSDDIEEVRKASKITNSYLLKIMEKTKESPPVEFMEIMPVIKEMLTVKKSNTAESALIWMRNLLQLFSSKLLPTINDVLSKLIEKLQDSEETVIQNVMDVLGNICLHEDYFNLVIEKILAIFYGNKEILHSKMHIVIKKLCNILNPERVYMAVAEKLNGVEDLSFVSSVVQTLDIILLTDDDLSGLRNVLKNVQFDETNKEKNLILFETLYKTWTYDPISTLTICFLCQEYELAYNIIISFSEGEMDVNTLIQIAKLISLLESPIFVYLRLQLLESNRHPYLLRCLCGLMMLLPQGKAFNTLKERLNNVNTLNDHANESSILFGKKAVNVIDKKKMIHIFNQAQNKMTTFLKKKKENEKKN